ncbi:GNAT family N-acetyltransferase [Staphylococcus xylosus]
MKIIKIKENQIEQVYPLMSRLRTHLILDEYLELVRESIEKDNYEMYGLYVEDKLASVIGFEPMTTLYYGRFIWVCDLVTDDKYRSFGYGEKLLSYIENLAKEKNYDVIALSSGLQRKSAHRFYEDKMEYNKPSYVFKKAL